MRSAVVHFFYFSDLNTRTIGNVNNFPENKIGRVIESNHHDASCLQGELKRLHDGAEEWQLEFRVGKCSVLSVDKNAPHVTVA